VFAGSPVNGCVRMFTVQLRPVNGNTHAH
jgi:hypothetical protein